MIPLIGSFLDLMIYILAFIAILSVIVFIHEFGHFQVARWCGVRVDVFSIGFGKRLFGWRDRHGTLWQVSALPLGGYVKFFGDVSPASAPDARVVSSIEGDHGEHDRSLEEAGGPADMGDSANRMPPRPRVRSRAGMTRFPDQEDRDKIGVGLSDAEKAVCFHFKPVWARATIVLAGPVANFILAIAIFAVLFGILGRSVIEPRVGGVVPGSPAAVAGLKTGDLIVSINDRKINTFNQLSMIVSMSSEDVIPMIVDRAGTRISLSAKPRREQRTDAFGNRIETGYLGVHSFIRPEVAQIVPDSPGARAGFLPGDRLISVNGGGVASFREFSLAVLDAASEPFSVGIEREGRQMFLQLDAGQLPDIGPGPDDGAPLEESQAGQGSGQGSEYSRVRDLGLIPPSSVIRQAYAPLSALGAGVVRTGDILRLTLTYLSRLIVGKEDISQMGGPLKIGQYAGQAAKTGFSDTSTAPVALWEKIKVSGLNMIQLAALISVSIGFLNLLPIPQLDGGHLMYYAYEAVAGRPLNMRVQMAGNLVGMVLLGILMVIVFTNDITQLFFRGA